MTGTRIEKGTRLRGEHHILRVFRVEGYTPGAVAADVLVYEAHCVNRSSFYNDEYSSIMFERQSVAMISLG